MQGQHPLFSGKREQGLRQPESFSVLHGIITTDIESRRGEPQQHYPSETERARAKLVALSKEAPRTAPKTPSASSAYLRSLEWEVGLECLGRDFRNWAAETAIQRQEYDIWRAKYLGADEMRESTSVELGNQGDLAESHLNPAFQLMPIKKIIIEDVNRTYTDNELFDRADIKCILKRILYIHARLNPSIGYVQGMNEILAPIVHVLHRDAEYAEKSLAAASEEEAAQAALMEGEYIRAKSPADLAPWEVRGVVRYLRRMECLENDAFRLFSRVMKTVGPWFNSCRAVNKKCEVEEEIEIVTKCVRVQKLLKIRDPLVYHQLVSLEIEPQLYIFKWVRILFAHVFPLESLLQVWDALFSVGITCEPYDLVDHICVTLLILIRTSIIGQDFTRAFSNLSNYPKGAAPVSLVLNIAISSMYSSLDRPFFEDTSFSMALPKTIPFLDIYVLRPQSSTYDASSAAGSEKRLSKSSRNRLRDIITARCTQQEQQLGQRQHEDMLAQMQEYTALCDRIAILRSTQEEVGNKVDQITREIEFLCAGEESSETSDDFYYADEGSLAQVLRDLRDVKYMLKSTQMNE